MNNYSKDRPWVKAHDPKYNRAYYANVVTRETQWEVPDGWYETPEGEIVPMQDEIDPNAQLPPSPHIAEVPSMRRKPVEISAPAQSSTRWGSLKGKEETSSSAVSSLSSRSVQNAGPKREIAPSVPPYRSESELPAGWEKLHDKASGRDYYVDHNNKKTQWTHPGSVGHTPSSSAGHTKHEKEVPATTSSLGFGGGFVPSAAKQSVKSSAPSEDMTFPSNTTYNQYSPRTRPYASHLQRSNSLRSTFSHDSNSTYHAQYMDHNNLRPSSYLETLGEAPPEFRVRHVKDEERMDCPGCQLAFSAAMRRRHHCRLCGDVFCDACSNHRCELPLDGPEFEKPVRVCDLCFADVDKGNYFSMRRYLSTLQLFDPGSKLPEENRDAARNVAGALASLASDFEAVLMDSSSFEEKITLPADVLIPSMSRHLQHPVTSMYSIRAISALLALGSVVGDNSFAYALLSWRGDEDRGEATCFFEALMSLLEKNAGSSRQLLHAQEQGVRALFYLTDPPVIEGVLQINSIASKNGGDGAEEGPVSSTTRTTEASSYTSSFISSFYVVPEKDKGGAGSEENELTHSNPLDTLDVHRALRNALDHATCASSPALQRWAVASVRHLVMEDKRRSMVAQEEGMGYKSFLDQFISTGAIMILCSLMSADDADTRSHATTALSSIVGLSRALSMGGKNENQEDSIVAAICEGGGCGSSLTEMMLSADESIAGMGCSFACLLVEPLFGRVNDLSAASCKSYIKAALAFADDGGCLPTLVDIARVRSTKSATMKRNAMVSLAASTLACRGEAGVSTRVERARSNIDREDLATVAFAILTGGAGTINNSSGESAGAQTQECAGIILDSLCRYSASAERLMSEKNAVFDVLSLCAEDDMTTSSVLCQHQTYRGQAALNCVSGIMFEIWVKSERPDKTDGSISSSWALDHLLECLDAGVVPLLGRALSQPDAGFLAEAQQVPFLISACRLTAAVFGISNSDRCVIARKRLYGAMETQAQIHSAYAYESHQGMRSSSMVDSLETNAVSLMSFSTRRAQQDFGGKDDRAMQDLIEACCLALGSMCGAKMLYSNEERLVSADFETSNDNSSEGKRIEFCRSASELLQPSHGNGLAAMIVGAFGEGCVNAALRLVLAIALNGETNVIAQSGVLIPIIDMLRTSFADGKRFRVSCCLALLRYGGGMINANSRESTRLLSAVRDSIDTVAGILVIPEDGMPSHEVAVLRQLKDESIFAMEAMSSNSSLWQSITNCFEAISTYLSNRIDDHGQEASSVAGMCSAIRTVRNVTNLPSTVEAAVSGGLATSLSALVLMEDDALDRSSAMDVKLAALEVLCNLCSYKGDGTSENDIWKQDALRAATRSMCVRCNHHDGIVSESQTFCVGMDLIHKVLEVTENDTLRYELVTVLCEDSRFVKLLCAYLLPSKQCKDNSERSMTGGNNAFHYDTKIAKHQDVRDAVVCVFIFMACFYSKDESNTKNSGRFWNDIGEEAQKYRDQLDGALMHLEFIAMIQSELLSRRVCLIQDASQDDLTRIQMRLVNEMIAIVEKGRDRGQKHSKITRLLLGQGLLKNSILLCKRFEDLTPVVCRLLGEVHSQSKDAVLSLLREDGVLSLTFDMLQTLVHGKSAEASSSAASEIICNILYSAAEAGDLGRLVRKYQMRLDAISALMSVCPANEGVDVEVNTFVEKDVVTTILWCLISVLFPELSFTDLREGANCGNVDVPDLDLREAEGIAVSLGTEISSLVVRQFEEQSQSRSSEEGRVISSPAVIMFIGLLRSDCLHLLNSDVTLEAINCLAAEANSTAIKALVELCGSEGSRVLNKKGHEALLKALLSIEETPDDESLEKMKESAQLRQDCLTALTKLCAMSFRNRKIVGDSPLCSKYVTIASEAVCLQVADSSKEDIAFVEAFLRLAIQIIRTKSIREILLRPEFIETSLKMLQDTSTLTLSTLSAGFLKVVAPSLSSNAPNEPTLIEASTDVGELPDPSKSPAAPESSDDAAAESSDDAAPESTDDAAPESSDDATCDIAAPPTSDDALGESPITVTCIAYAVCEISKLFDDFKDGCLRTDKVHHETKLCWLSSILELVQCLSLNEDQRTMMLQNIASLAELVVQGKEEVEDAVDGRLTYNLISLCFDFSEFREFLNSTLIAFILRVIIENQSSSPEKTKGKYWQGSVAKSVLVLAKLLKRGQGETITSKVEEFESDIQHLQLALERIQASRDNPIAALAAEECATWI